MCLSSSIEAQVDHPNGFFLRYLVGWGQGSIRDIAQNPVSGDNIRTSLDLGGFVTDNFALHVGLDYVNNPSIYFVGKSTNITRSGKYNYLSSTAGFTYFTPVGIYFGASGRFMINSYYELRGSVYTQNLVIDTCEYDEYGNRIVIDRSITTPTPIEKGSFSRSTPPFGVAAILGTEEWLVNHGVGLGIAFIYSIDSAPLRNNNFNLMFSLTYNKL